MEVKITTIIFDQNIRIDEISSLRGALLTLLPDNPILHNHIDDTVLYRYPKVQYKLIDGKAGVTGIAEGAEILESEFATGDELSLKIGRKVRRFTVIEKKTSYFNPDSQASPGFRYEICGWLPLNQKNYQIYMQTDSLKDKIGLLDSILTINILAAHKKGMGHIIDHECIAYITDIMDISTAKHKGVEMLSFDVRICTNTALPQYISLGKGSARGYGTVTELK